MTVTKRKIYRPQAEERVAQETGIAYTCDICAADISHTVRIRCAQMQAEQPAQNTEERPTKKRKKDEPKMVNVCEDFDMCGTCFIQGKETGRHKRSHDYRVVEPHAYPIYCNDWGADEQGELLLIDACQTYGLGNWQDIAEHIGSYRTKEEVSDHYNRTYIQSDVFPLPAVAKNLNTDQVFFQENKKARLEAAQNKPLAMPPPKPAASVPICHEVGSFMPARLEFEHEFENDAETMIKDMEFGLVMRYGGDNQPVTSQELAAFDSPKVKIEPDTEEKDGNEEAKTDDAPADVLVEEEDDDLDLKMTMLEMYNSKYDKRVEAKSLIFDRNLVEYKKLLIQDKKRSKEEKDIANRVKVFARLHSASDHDALVSDEIVLRKRIAELQEYRRAGLVFLNEVEKYDRDKAVRNATRTRDALAGFPRLNKSQARPFDSREGTPRPHRRIPQIPNTLANSSSLHLLSPAERFLCSRLGIFPKPFLFIKQAILREYARNQGQLERKRVRALFRMDPGKINAIYDFLIARHAQALVNGNH